MNNKAVVKQGQNFLDKVIQHTGSLNNMFEVATMNNVCITGDDEGEIKIGTELEVPFVITNKQIVSTWKEGVFEPATGLDPTQKLILEGIEYWFVDEYEIR